MPINVGDTAPNFTLKHSKGDTLTDVSLADSKGKPILLLFFPMAGTGVCTKEMCSVSDGLGDYAGSGAVVFGISTDTPYGQEFWAKLNDINVTLLADFDKVVSKQWTGLYSPFKGYTGGVSKRAAFVIDMGGVVRYAWISEEAGAYPPFDEINGALKKVA